MIRRHRPTLLALAGLLICSACADKPTTSHLAMTTPQQYSSMQWDEATAAQTAAHVTNNNLIMMR